MILVSFKGPCTYKLYICLVDNGASCVITLEGPSAVVDSICVCGLGWLLSGNRGTIHISCTVTWSQCCDGCWKRLTCCLTLEAITCLILVSFKGPFSYKLHICLVHDCIGCVISLEGPSAIVHCIGVSSLGWLLSGNRGTIHISCTIAWSQGCDGCWKSFSCCLTLEAVTCLILVSFKGPCTYKLHICLVHDCIGCVVTLKGPCAVVHCVGVSGLRWLLSGNRVTIHICCTVAWSQGCDGCWKSLTCCCALEAISSLVLVSFKGPFSYKFNISLVDYSANCVITLEGPCAVVHRICVSGLGWLLSGNRGTIHICCTVTWSQCGDGCWKSFTYCRALEAVSSLILVSFKLPLTCESQISFFHKLTFGIVTKESPGTIVHIIFVSLCCRLFWYNFLRVVIA